MIVTFISQCEKKSLPRTRRVLDAFANRIGDNVWQTVITHDGLYAVKKLLRKTASKNTAVACHYLKTRRRTELAWVVGRKNAFNNTGATPVNFTSKEVIMDPLPDANSHLLANTKQQPLAQHLFAVGFTAYYLLETLHVDNPNLKQAAFIAGILHDIGKIDPQFQNYIKKKAKIVPEAFIPDDGEHIDKPIKFSFEKHPRHNEISWLFAQHLLMKSNLNSAQHTQINHGIYWHHTKPFRKDDQFTSAPAIQAIFEESLSQKSMADIYTTIHSTLNDIKTLSEKFDVAHLIPEFSKSLSSEESNLPDYKKYDHWNNSIEKYKNNVQHNALNNLVRMAVISADRLVSSCTKEDLEEYLTEKSLNDLVNNQTEEKSLLRSGIEQCLLGFEKKYPDSARNKSQTEAASKLAELQTFAELNDSANIGVLQGPAGCGKTKIALEWASKTHAKKILWVCPRVQVCMGLLNDLTSADYLTNNQIEIFTGEHKKILRNGMSFDSAPDTEEDSYFSGDIIITTIDQAVNAILTHNKVTTMIELMQSHVVFDEFHELINMPALNLLFSELIEAKKQQGAQANTLLVSATPHYFFLNQFLDIPSQDIIGIESFNTSSYQVTFETFNETSDENPLLAEQKNNQTFVISNTAQDAQLGYLLNHQKENSVLLHSKYTKQDQNHCFQQVFNTFKRDGNKQYDVLHSGPIVQASLNISCDHMVTEITCAENWLQRLGRLNRFGINQTTSKYITIVPESIQKYGKQTSACAKFLNHLNIWQSTKAWLTFLQDKLSESNEVSLNHLYKIYQEFYNDSASQKAIEADLLLVLKKSEKLINKKIIDPIFVPPKSTKNQTIKISTHSLRGDNRFVQMATCNITETLALQFPDIYAYDEEIDTNQPLPCLTESVDRIRGYDEDNKNLVDFMLKKHHNIKKGSGYKKARNEWELIKTSRSPETPIYLSYTPHDLESVGGSSVAHSSALYYVICNKQPIGAMPIEKINSLSKNTCSD